MQLHQLRPTSKRPHKKRVGRGGKRGTTSGHGTKGQKGRAGASVKPGFRGGDSRMWQKFPKLRGASKKMGGSGNKSPHRKHRYFSQSLEARAVVNVGALNIFADGQTITGSTLAERGLVSDTKKIIKILGDGVLKRKLIVQDVLVSKSAVEKITKAGGKVENSESGK